MITLINHKTIRCSMRSLIENGLRIGETAAKSKKQPFYPTHSGMNIKIPKDPFLNTSDGALIRFRRDTACDTVHSSIPDGYTKDMGIGFGLESKKDIMLEIAKPKEHKGLGWSLDDWDDVKQVLEVKIGELITPPHLYKKCPQLEPHYYIDELWSKGKNTGANAIKNVVLQSLNDSETQGRVLLQACNIDGKTSPVGFYYKLGFRSTNPQTNEACAKWLAEGGKMTNAPGGSDTMYLPKENIQHCLNYGLDIKA